MANAYAQVRIKGMRETFLYLRRVKARTKKKAKLLTEKIAMKIQRRARKLVGPLHTGTGDLKRSIQVVKGKNGYSVVAGRGLKKPYAYYQEKGFMAHRIHYNMIDPRARSKWPYSRRGYVVSRWTPFMAPAFRHVLASIESELNRTANKIVRG